MREAVQRHLDSITAQTRPPPAPSTSSNRPQYTYSPYWHYGYGGYLNTINVVAFDQRCEDWFQDLRAQRKLRVGSQDLKIAATAIAHGLIVVTRNRRDFQRVTDLAIEDWSA